MAKRRGAGPPAPHGLPAQSRRPDPLAVVGDVVVVRSLGADRLGEVCVGEGPRGPVRIRFCSTTDVSALAQRVTRLGRLRSPHVAPVLDRLTDTRRRVAVLTPTDHLTLAERRRRGPIDQATLLRLGAVLLEGLADLRRAGLHHGYVEAASVGVDARGRPRWQDAALADLPRAGDAEALDVAGLARLLRGLGPLPERLAGIVDDTASGVPGAPETVAALAAAWHEAAAAVAVELPPPGSAAELAALLPPARASRSLPRLRLPALTRRRRLAAAAALAALGAGVVPAARLVHGGADPTAELADYRPGRAGETLVYQFTQHSAQTQRSGTVSLRVSDLLTVAGVPTLKLVPAGSDPAANAGLPLGLAGTTLRVQDGALERTLGDGFVRDLVGPLRPGQSWSDERTAGGFHTVEQRTILGPASVDVAAGHFDRCLAVEVTVTSMSVTNVAGTSTARVFVWNCPGTGLTRALLQNDQESDTIDLVGVQG